MEGRNEFGTLGRGQRGKRLELELKLKSCRERERGTEE